MSRENASQERAVLITGCSSGIGEACARDLAAHGLRVFAGVRQEADAQRWRDQAAGRVEPVLLDVAEPEMVRSAANTLERSLGESGLAGLVNNAGIVVPGPLELLSTADFRRQLEVNVLGTHAVTQAMLPLLRRAGGRIVMVSSISGRVAPPFYGAYAASKHALEAMADSLRRELRPWRIRVSVVEPDSVATAIWDKLDRGLGSLARQADPAASDLYEAQMRAVRKATAGMGRLGMPTSAVVRAVRHAICARRPKVRYPLGLRTRLAIWGASHLPASVMDWFLRRSVGLN
jgi:NAD(P)-dependent dehydrogenase (short-subunit alcohol dehydrogenase family)